MAPIIQLIDVSYNYPLSETPAVEGLNLSFEEGTFYGVIGQNGSGKTTLCNIIRGFIPSFYKGDLRGSVLIDGKKSTDYDEGDLALKIGYVFQNPFNQISGAKDTVFEEVAFGLENFGVPVEEIRKRVKAIMELTMIDHLAGKNPFELSGGQQQRAALASILVLEPEILVIDEPTSQLDPEGTESVFKIIAALKDAKKTIILVEHKVDLIAEFADQVIVIQNGSVVKAGPTRAILSDISMLEKGVQLPQIALLKHELIKCGLPIEGNPITVEEATETLKKIRRGERV